MKNNEINSKKVMKKRNKANKNKKKMSKDRTTSLFKESENNNIDDKIQG